MQTRRDIEDQARIFKALGHPSRLAMVDALGDGERCVCELRELVGADMSTVSKHLSLLRDAGVVCHEKRGNQVFYSLAMPCVTAFMGCVQRIRLRSLSQELGEFPPRDSHNQATSVCATCTQPGRPGK